MSQCASGRWSSAANGPTKISAASGGLGAAPSLLTAADAAARQQHIADALDTLREAIAAGWKDFAHMQKDPDLTVLRELPDFKALLPQSDSNEKR